MTGKRQGQELNHRKRKGFPVPLFLCLSPLVAEIHFRKVRLAVKGWVSLHLVPYWVTPVVLAWDGLPHIL